MGDEEGGVPYSWTSAEPQPDGGDPPTAKWVKVPGKAKVAYPNADTYEGSFNDARQKHGRGTYTWSTNTGSNPWVPEEGFPEGKAPTVKYEGQYVEGKKQGIGKMTFPNGDKYHGMWEADRFHGEGTYYYSATKDIYSGHWNRGVKQGEGVMMFAADESQLVGRWEKGTFVAGKWVMKDGTSWHGPFKRGKPLGKGVFFFPNGTMQEGEYVLEGEGGEEGEAEEEDPTVELKTVWRGGPIVPTTADAREILRAPPTTL